MSIMFVVGYVAVVYLVLSALKHVTRTPPAPVDDDVVDPDIWRAIVEELEHEDS